METIPKKNKADKATTDINNKMKPTIWQTWRPFIFAGIGIATLIGLAFWYGFDLFPSDKEKRVGFIATNLLSVFALAVIITQAIIYFRQWRAMHKQGELMEKQLELTDRPWLAVDAVLNSPLTFDDQGGHLGFVIAARNIGRSVAINATINAEIVIPAFVGNFWATVIEKQKRLCKNVRSDVMAYAIFPEHHYSSDITFGIPQEDISGGKIGESNIIQMYIVGCVDYQFSGHEQHHQTGFVWEIMHTNADQITSPLPIDSSQNYPLEHLVLRKMIVGGGEYAT